MASTARRPAAPAATQAADKMGEVATKSVVDVRDYFPDTWLFDLEMTKYVHFMFHRIKTFFKFCYWNVSVICSEEGVYVTKEKLPHTITEWVGSAVCISDEDGLGLSNTTSIKGFQAFFLSTTLPYSVVRGESFWITISIFNYVEDALAVSFQTVHSFEFTVVLNRLHCGNGKSCNIQM